MLAAFASSGTRLASTLVARSIEFEHHERFGRAHAVEPSVAAAAVVGGASAGCDECKQALVAAHMCEPSHPSCCLLR